MTGRTFAEFFAGIGLMRLGLEKAGWEIVYANDIDPVKKKIYEGHFGLNNHFQLGDIHHLQPEDIPRVTLATASFPCTDLSVAGRRNGLAGPQSSAFWGFVNVLKKFGSESPEIILLENVAGFISSNKGKDFKDALIALNELGYAVDAFIINAFHFVPQSRERLFIVGHKKNKIPALSICQAPPFQESESRPHKLAEFIFENADINWQIRDLPDLPKMNTLLSDIIEKKNDRSKLWWPQQRTDYLFSQMSHRHRAIVESLINSNQFNYGTVFRRVRNKVCMAELRFDGIAGCLRTPKGGSAKQILFRFGKGTIAARLLSPKECARLMGAEEYAITGTIDQALFGFGDAVCVPVIKWIGENYLNPLYNELTLRHEPSKSRVLPSAIRAVV